VIAHCVNIVEEERKIEIIVKKKAIEEEEEAESEVDPAQLATLLSFPQMIESANFPVVKDGVPLSLPNDANATNILKEALKSRKLNPGTSRRWQRLLSSASSSSIFTSAFWYHLASFWDRLTEFSPQLNMRKVAQESDPVKIEAYKTQLLNSASKSYVKTFLDYDGVDKDDFFFILPDLISQAVVLAYTECFPRSSSLYDETFSKDTIALIYTNVVGIEPFKVLENWPKKKSNWDTGGFVKGKAAQGKPSCSIGPNYKTIKKQFDVYGNSPVVSNYLKEVGAKNDRKRLSIHRSQVVKDFAEDTTLPTYRQLVTDSLKKSRARDRAYDEVERNARLARKKANTDFIEDMKSHVQKTTKILLKSELVKEMSTQVLESQETRRRNRLAKTSTVSPK
jgi:hypothetical protein